MKIVLGILSVLVVGMVILDLGEQSSVSKSPVDLGFADKAEGSLALPGIPQPRTIQEAAKLEGEPMGATPLEAAENYLALYRERWGIQPYHELRPQVSETPIGANVKYTVFQDGYSVIGLSIEMQVDSKMRVTSVENSYRPVGKVDLDQKVLEPEEIVDYAGKSYFSDEGATNGLSSILFLVPGATQPELAYVIPMFDKSPTPRPVQVVFRARDGQVLSNSFARTEF